MKTPLLLLSLLVLTGCMTAKLDENRTMATAIGKDEGIVILAKPRAEGAAAEDEFMDCVGQELAKGSPAVAVYDNNLFQDQLFPWFEPSTAPIHAEGLTSLLARRQVAERLAASGVRYVVWLDGNTRKTDSGGSLACAAGPGGAGCLGFGWWEKQSDYEATIWDLKQSKSAGSVMTNVKGTSAIVGLLVPLPFVARVQGAACDRMAMQLRGFLKGQPLAPAGGHT
jgi:hypothetical protein